MAWRTRQKNATSDKITAPAAAPVRENLEALLKVKLLAVELGLGLVQLVEGPRSSVTSFHRCWSPTASH